ncbi:hypothetical protein OH77DRAFT_1016004 [Trametes cingulata]|nr:hypothetical protein OH77DRAFT_1016004 [Trametes cingulata]
MVVARGVEEDEAADRDTLEGEGETSRGAQDVPMMLGRTIDAQHAPHCWTDPLREPRRDGRAARRWAGGAREGFARWMCAGAHHIDLLRPANALEAARARPWGRKAYSMSLAGRTVSNRNCRAVVDQGTGRRTGYDRPPARRMSATSCVWTSAVCIPQAARNEARTRVAEIRNIRRRGPSTQRR